MERFLWIRRLFKDSARACWLVCFFFLFAGTLTAQQINRQVVTDSQQTSDVLQQAGREIATAAAMTRQAVVHIESQRTESGTVTEETGSGVLISSPRFSTPFIVTNRHVVIGAELEQIEILLSDGRVVSPYEMIEDESSDLAVMKIRSSGLKPAQWGDSDNLDIGNFVLAMGSPFGLNQSVTLGIISAKARRSLELPGGHVSNQDFLQTDAAINPGNSGGPLVDLNGRIVGINTAIASQGGGNEGIGFSIPSNLVQFVVTQLLEHGRVRRGYLGVELDNEFDLETARRFSLNRVIGARITRVRAGTPAARSGLRPDDIIINFDGIEIEDENDLINRVSLTPVNKQVRIVVIRNGQEQTFLVVLAEKPAGQSTRPLDLNRPVDQRFRNSSLTTRPVTPNLAKQIGFTTSQRGLIVMSIESPKENQNLELYDVIEEVARQPVASQNEFEKAIAAIEGEPILLKVCRVRNGQAISKLVLWNPAEESTDDRNKSEVVPVVN